MSHLKRVKNWLDNPVTNAHDRRAAAQIQRRADAVRAEIAEFEAEWKRRRGSKRCVVYRQKMDRLNDQLDYELQRGRYAR